jgi:hypothetical protein
MSPRHSPGPSRTGVNLGDDEIVRDWSLSVEDVTEVMRARGAEHRLRFAVQLCALRATGRFLSDYKQVPIEALGYLAQQLGLTPVLFLTAAERPATETAHAARIREYLGYREFDAEAEQRLRDRLQTAAMEGATPAQLLNLAKDLLRSGRIVQPAQSTLERLGASVASTVIQDLYERVMARLPEGFRDAIDDLVSVPEGEHRSPLSRFKEAPPAAKAPAIAASLARFCSMVCLDRASICRTSHRNFSSTLPSWGGDTMPWHSSAFPPKSDIRSLRLSWSRCKRPCWTRSSRRMTST